MAARLEVMPFDEKAAAHFGQLRAELAKAGKSMGPYDVMIAGHVRALVLVLITNNLKEFERVPGLGLGYWV